MSTEGCRPRHIVFIRHGESEGDVRRAANMQSVNSVKHPRDEEQTELGYEQSRAAGLWVAKFILRAYGMKGFDAYLTSPLIRTKQSANSTELSENWVDEPRLAERNRGAIQGMTKQKHQQLFPKSYQQMIDHPFHWTPPDGESLMKVSYRLTDLLLDVNKKYNNVLMMTHRDLIWSAHMSIDGLSLDEIERVDTDQIGNGHIFHYTNINPDSGLVDGEQYTWKRSIDPSINTPTIQANDWVPIVRSHSQV